MSSWAQREFQMSTGKLIGTVVGVTISKFAHGFVFACGAISAVHLLKGWLE